MARSVDKDSGVRYNYHLDTSASKERDIELLKHGLYKTSEPGTNPNTSRAHSQRRSSDQNHYKTSERTENQSISEAPRTQEESVVQNYDHHQ